MNDVRIACLGEAMVELCQTGADEHLLQLGYGGDCFNTAVALGSLGASVAFASLLGPDRFSQGLRQRCKELGVDTDLLFQSATGRPGLYCIQTGPDGERQFEYWRHDSIARQLLTDGTRVQQLRPWAAAANWPWPATCALPPRGRASASPR